VTDGKAPPSDAAQQFVFHARVALGIWLDGKKKTETFEQAMEALDDASVKLEKPPPSDAAPVALTAFEMAAQFYKDEVLTPEKPSSSELELLERFALWLRGHGNIARPEDAP